MGTIKPLYYVCLLKKFNNYFNRIIKGYTTLEEYEEASEAFYFYSKPVNFNFNDNVSTELIMNDCPFEPDYLLLLTPSEDETGYDIVSRWFVLETIFTREAQYKHQIRRDVIYDHIENLLDSPMFVQKAHLQESDPFIFNDEGMSFNEIKTSETLLKDRTNSAWACVYIAKNAAPSDVTIQQPDETFEALSLSTMAAELGITEGALAALINFDNTNTIETRVTTQVEFRYGSQVITANIYSRLEKTQLFYNGSLTSIINSGNVQALSWSHPLWKDTVISGADRFRTSLKAAIVSNKTGIKANIATASGRTYLDETALTVFNKYLNQIFVYGGKYYQFKFANSGAVADPVLGPSAYTTWASLASAVTTAGTATAAFGSVQSGGEVSIRTTSNLLYLYFEEVSAESGLFPGVTTKVSSSRNVIQSQAFDMIAIPYGEVVFNDGTYKTSIKEYALTVASAIAVELDAACYDVQLLPYCPALPLFDSNGRIDLTALTEGKDFDYIDQTNSEVGYTLQLDDIQIAGNVFRAFGSIPNTDISDIVSYDYIVELLNPITITNQSINAAQSGTSVVFEFDCTLEDERDADYLNVWATYTKRGVTDHKSFLLYLKSSTFSTVIDKTLTMTDSAKIDCLCDKYRLVSPNYQGTFDFNLAKNGGSVEYFLAECTYKPYTPHIKVAPSLSGLYGSNFGDCRGLICGGDFSLPRFTDAWEAYELNNKNYQNIFNREIQNLDLEQSLQMRTQQITGGLGVATAGIAGAGLGAKVGGGWGAAAGAAIGTSGSAAGMALDLTMLGIRQREEKSLTIDKFNYQLGNVKALPYTLTKIGAFDINSKIWPFLEYYTCTPEEKEALINKITYESMTVMRIGTLREFISDEKHYFKAELIRNEAIAEDNHIFEAIYTEFVKGVYI